MKHDSIVARRFSVSLSFPGEKRDYVRKVAGCLADSLGKDKVFFDEYYEAELAVLNLDLKLQKIYKNESDLVVPFFCAKYAEKNWCKVEWDAIRAAIFSKRKDDAVMAIRFDDAEIDGFLETAGYISVNSRQPHEIASLILKRVKTISISSCQQVHQEEHVNVDIVPHVTASLLPINRIKNVGRKLRISEEHIRTIITRSRPIDNLHPFKIAKYCVTNDEYWSFVQDNATIDWPSQWEYNLREKYGTPFADSIAICPVTNVSLEDAKKYCLWKKARLPTSAEWEYAASAGHERIYPWGDNFNSDCCNSIEQKSNTISPVSNFPKGNTPSGIRQMAGNVWEMTTGTSKTLELRGGSYRSLCEFWGGFFAFKIIDRNKVAADIGFRLVIN